MTLYRPIVSDGSRRIKECTFSTLNAMYKRIAYLYVQNPSVILSVVASGGNISPTMTDTRLKSGTAKRNTSGNWPQVTTFPSQAQTGEPQTVTLTYDKINQTTSSHATVPTYNLKPVRTDASGVREMTFTDVIDSFISPVVSNIVTGTTDTLAGGAYFISTSTSISNCTNLGTVYTDTRANVSGYLASNIGGNNSVQDVFNSTDYQLFRNDGAVVAYRTPLIIDGTSGLRHMTFAEFDAFFQPLIQAYIFNQGGNTLRYNVDGNGVTKGTAMVNNVLTGGNGNYTRYKASANDYRAQEFPNGTNSVANTYRLKVERT